MLIWYVIAGFPSLSQTNDQHPSTVCPIPDTSVALPMDTVMPVSDAAGNESFWFASA